MDEMGKCPEAGTQGRRQGHQGPQGPRGVRAAAQGRLHPVPTLPATIPLPTQRPRPPQPPSGAGSPSSCRCRSPCRHPFCPAPTSLSRPPGPAGSPCSEKRTRSGLEASVPAAAAGPRERYPSPIFWGRSPPRGSPPAHHSGHPVGSPGRWGPAVPPSLGDGSAPEQGGLGSGAPQESGGLWAAGRHPPPRGCCFLLESPALGPARISPVP